VHAMLSVNSPGEHHACSTASDSRCVLVQYMLQRMTRYCRGSTPSATNTAKCGCDIMSVVSKHQKRYWDFESADTIWSAFLASSLVFYW